MYRLPEAPSPQAGTHELADFAELLAWRQGVTSTREILAALGRMDENDRNEGCDDNSDVLAGELDEVMNEVERRANACGIGYPFSLEKRGSILRYRGGDGEPQSDIYIYLLLSTRLNMRSSRVHAGIDGAHLLEELSAFVLKNYLGSKRARSLVFGTAAPGKFEIKINNLCKELKEGGKFRTMDEGSVDANDDKLDVVAWIPFSDESCSKLIIFAQCKTGSTWRDQITQLQPEAFISRWMSESFALNPVRALCLAEAVDRSHWFGICTYAGLLLDRCRIIDFCFEISGDLLDRIRSWSTAAVAVTFETASPPPQTTPCPPQGCGVRGRSGG